MPYRSPVWVGKTNSAILNGTEDVSLWSDEELLRGQRRASNGRWPGRPPKVVPKAIHDEMGRRRMLKAHDLLRDNLLAAVEVLVTIARDKRAEDKDRLKAVGMIMDRVLGKVPERVHLAPDVEPPFVTALREG